VTSSGLPNTPFLDRIRVCRFQVNFNRLENQFSAVPIHSLILRFVNFWKSLILYLMGKWRLIGFWVPSGSQMLLKKGNAGLPLNDRYEQGKRKAGTRVLIQFPPIEGVQLGRYLSVITLYKIVSMNSCLD